MIVVYVDQKETNTVSLGGFYYMSSIIGERMVAARTADLDLLLCRQCLACVVVECIRVV